MQWQNTPNPNALKCTIGVPVGGPSTYKLTDEIDRPFVLELLRIAEVRSIFLTADFISITKSPAGDWNLIAPAAMSVLETEFNPEINPAVE